ncbi:hypothetical protein SAMN05518672_11582 [Chitinophaga sp. CF118]|uniref:hypothetical protein n=1 Tax=Chitinophaga sp. CF118 TaxID=1884367 RepID=UPI0008F406AA|nr:hypothetical protein [Chitinophaga sp. CF118]SFF07546.1 hypothetical protein SAMN05518672_11582 [Chitinophaga sp. CF118]
MNYLLFEKFLVLIFLVSCTRAKPRSSCKFESIKTLYTDIGIQPGIDTAFCHAVLIKDFSRECLDSITILRIAKSYIDTVSASKKPVDIIKFYSSDKDFDLSEGGSQLWDEVNKSCLVIVNFNYRIGSPTSFIFFNEKGEIIHDGPNWK